MTLTGGPYFPPGGPAPADYEAFANLTGSRNAGFNPWTSPNAIQDGGIVTFGWVDGFGNVECAEYDEATETTSAQVTIAGSFEVDAHASPALCRRASDDRWIVVYAKHNSTPINVRLSSTSSVTGGFGAATNIDSQLGGSRYTDYSIFERSNTLWLVYRDEPSAGTDSRWCISSCASATPTSAWAAQTIVFRQSGTRSYVITTYDPTADRLHFITTNAASTGFTKLGHFYRDMAAGTYHKTDGTAITLPIEFDDVTEIYSGTNTVFAANVVVDASGDIAVAAQDTIASDIRCIYVRWDGSVWDSTNVVSAGTGYVYGGGGATAWGQCIDAGDLDVFWVLRDTGGTAQLYAYITADDGDTFSESQVTDDLTNEQTQIVCVRNPDKLRAIWQSGTWTSYTSWNQTASGVRTP